MQAYDPACLEAFARLLAQPDPPDLPPRTHVRRCEGDPNRRDTRLPAILMGWLQRRHRALDVDESLSSATARRAVQSRLSRSRLRLVRSTTGVRCAVGYTQRSRHAPIVVDVGRPPAADIRIVKLLPHVVQKEMDVCSSAHSGLV
jgi:hypothetical protein